MSSGKTDGLTRRGLLAGLLTSAAGAALAGAPEISLRPLPRGTVPVQSVPQTNGLVQAVNLGGDVGFAVADTASGELLDVHLPDTLLPPASTLKVVTSLYALDRLGADFRFRTEVLGTAAIVNGRLDGDLILKGGGDPTLDTDRMGDIAVKLREAGLHEVTGRFLVWRDALPHGDRIDDDQPEYVGYNPAFGGLNLNYNRVHFQWEKSGDGYDITMDARGVKFSPATSVAHMSVVDRSAPVYEYHAGRERDGWSVARSALGDNGARWLPVRYPAIYAGDVFRTLARSNGIVLKAPEVVEVMPAAELLVTSESEPLVPLLRDMLKYSTNLTAEASGLTASLANEVPVGSLLASGSRMAGWAMERFAISGLKFRDHSGLGYGSAISPVSMVQILNGGRTIAPLLKTVDLSLDKKRPAPSGVEVRAKTGTLNFVSALAGYVKTRGGRQLSFAIFTADVGRRDAIPPEERERPQGARGWSQRSRQLQKELLRTWAARFDV
jgi:serine-type D-Ala-D-Ala carboxypeptidase/endopeptidase (penicillin-binding protein 4)